MAWTVNATNPVQGKTGVATVWGVTVKDDTGTIRIT
jgi:hypothetical protein